MYSCVTVSGIVQSTPDNSNPCLLELKSISPGFPSQIYYNFTSVTRTLDNSILPLTQSKFCFPSDHFYINLPSITWTMLWAPDKLVEQKVHCSPKHWIYFNNHELCTLMSVQFKYSVQHWVFIKPWSVRVTWIHSPSHSLLVLVIYFELWLTQTIFNFPWRFELSGVDCRHISWVDHELSVYPPAKLGAY